MPGNRWGEGIDLQDTLYPLGLVSLHYDPVMYDWSGQVALVGVDVVVISKENMGEASQLAQLAYTSLHGARLTVSGQTSISCQFMSGISLVDVDKEGKAVYEAGGIFEIRVTQRNPALGSLALTVDSTIA